MARYLVVDVFTSELLAGNALAVFPDPNSVPGSLMQSVAREMNLSETTFVTSISASGYEVRIFTPYEEMTFAGHPTLGTAWTLRHLGVISEDHIAQRSPAGETRVQFIGDLVWLERAGIVGPDFDPAPIGLCLGLPNEQIGIDASDLGAPATRLMPAVSDAGVAQLMVPISDPKTLEALVPTPAIGDLIHDGVYCFAPLGPGRVKARFFGNGSGIMEDPATGSAAAALGLFVAARAGACSFTIEQGAEIRRPSIIFVEAEPGRARVGGSVRFVAEGIVYV